MELVMKCFAVHALIISLDNFQMIILTMVCVCATLVISFMMAPPIVTTK
jgi:hypothetical protein